MSLEQNQYTTSPTDASKSKSLGKKIKAKAQIAKEKVKDVFGMGDREKDQTSDQSTEAYSSSLAPNQVAAEEHQRLVDEVHQAVPQDNLEGAGLRHVEAPRDDLSDGAKQAFVQQRTEITTTTFPAESQLGQEQWKDQQWNKPALSEQPAFTSATPAFTEKPSFSSSFSDRPSYSESEQYSEQPLAEQFKDKLGLDERPVVDQAKEKLGLDERPVLDQAKEKLGLTEKPELTRQAEFAERPAFRDETTVQQTDMKQKAAAAASSIATQISSAASSAMGKAKEMVGSFGTPTGLTEEQVMAISAHERLRGDLEQMSGVNLRHVEAPTGEPTAAVKQAFVAEQQDKKAGNWRRPIDKEESSAVSRLPTGMLDKAKGLAAKFWWTTSESLLSADQIRSVVLHTRLMNGIHEFVSEDGKFSGLRHIDWVDTSPSAAVKEAFILDRREGRRAEPEHQPTYSEMIAEKASSALETAKAYLGKTTPSKTTTQWQDSSRGTVDPRV